MKQPKGFNLTKFLVYLHIIKSCKENCLTILWYIYLDFAVTETDDSELGLILLMWRWRGILSSVSSCY